MTDKRDPRTLCGHWMHSHEEDTPAGMVFRPASYPFPPARGRQGFDLKLDGSMTSFGIGPTDRRQATSGRWSIDESGNLILEAGPRRVMTIVAVSKDKLVLGK